MKEFVDNKALIQRILLSYYFYRFKQCPTCPDARGTANEVCCNHPSIQCKELKRCLPADVWETFHADAFNRDNEVVPYGVDIPTREYHNSLYMQSQTSGQGRQKRRAISWHVTMPHGKKTMQVRLSSKTVDRTTPSSSGVSHLAFCSVLP